MDSVKKYKCLHCGAGLEFNPTNQDWKCHYCYSAFSIKEVEDAYKDPDDPNESLNQEMPELDTYSCSSCGAELIADDTISATFCLYCRNPTIIKNRFSGRFAPKYVIPFKLTKEEAKQLYSKWIKKRIFAPKQFKLREEVDKVTGIYAPYWLFDCNVQGQIQGVGTRVRTWTAGNLIYTETSYYNVSREGKTCYKRIPVDGSKKLDDAVMEKVEPFDYSKITDFSLPYMSGFMAEKYDVDAAEAAKAMENRVRMFFKNRLRGTINSYNSFSEENFNANLGDVDNNYTMLPIYLLVNKYKEKEHLFIVNGQTGKVIGNTPIDRKKQLLFFGVATAITFIITLFGGAFLA